MKDSREQEIIQLLEAFQAGYSQRNLNFVDSFVEQLFVDAPDLLVIGTAAVTMESGEWCRGKQQVTEIIKGDWEHWGDLELDIKNAQITLDKETALIGLCGTVTEEIQPESYYRYRLALVKQVLEQDACDKIKLLRILQGTADTLLQTEHGKIYCWPLRLSAVAVRVQEKWFFKQIHFSYPITFYPQERLVDPK